MLIGYARTSTTEQEAGLEAQRRDLRASGCYEIFEEQRSQHKAGAFRGSGVSAKELCRLRRDFKNAPCRSALSTNAKNASTSVNYLATHFGRATGLLKLAR